MLKSKIGQMLLLGFKGSELNQQTSIQESIQRHHLGGVILFDFDYQAKKSGHNIRSPEQLKQLTLQLHACAKEANASLPLLIGIDYEGGQVNRLKPALGFPATLSAREMGQTSPLEMCKAVQTMAQTLQACHINLNFAPVLDVNIHANNPVIGKLDRSFSAHPQKVIDCAAMFSKIYAAHQLLYTYKHFPGHGSATGDTHAGFVDVTQTWRPHELLPYRRLVATTYSAPLIMTAHVVHKGLDRQGFPASLSKTMTQHLLREQIGFQGVVITDDLQMKAITDHYGLKEAVILAINAGADMLIFGNQLTPIEQTSQELIDLIYAAVLSGKIATSRIDQAHQRIVRMKKRLNSQAFL